MLSMKNESANNSNNQDIFTELMKEVSTHALLKESGASFVEGKILVIIVGVEQYGKLQESKSILPKYCNIRNESELKSFIKKYYSESDALYVRYFRPGDIELSEITKYIVKI